MNIKDIYLGKAIANYGECCGVEAEFLKRVVRPVDVVIEVGAYIGFHTASYAKSAGKNGRVCAFELQRACYFLFEAQIALSQLDNIYACGRGMGHTEGKLWASKIDYSVFGNFRGIDLSRSQSSSSEEVEIGTLDGMFGGSPCALLKIDFEGMEEDAILGGRDVIKTNNPIIYVENDRLGK